MMTVVKRPDNLVLRLPHRNGKKSLFLRLPCYILAINFLTRLSFKNLCSAFYRPHSREMFGRVHPSVFVRLFFRALLANVWQSSFCKIYNSPAAHGGAITACGVDLLTEIYKVYMETDTSYRAMLWEAYTQKDGKLGNIINNYIDHIALLEI